MTTTRSRRRRRARTSAAVVEEQEEEDDADGAEEDDGKQRGPPRLLAVTPARVAAIRRTLAAKEAEAVAASQAAEHAAAVDYAKAKGRSPPAPLSLPRTPPPTPPSLVDELNVVKRQQGRRPMAARLMPMSIPGRTSSPPSCGSPRHAEIPAQCQTPGPPSGGRWRPRMRRRSQHPRLRSTPRPSSTPRPRASRRPRRCRCQGRRRQPLRAWSTSSTWSSGSAIVSWPPALCRCPSQAGHQARRHADLCVMPRSPPNAKHQARRHADLCVMPRSPPNARHQARRHADLCVMPISALCRSLRYADKCQLDLRGASINAVVTQPGHRSSGGRGRPRCARRGCGSARRARRAAAPRAGANP